MPNSAIAKTKSALKGQALAFAVIFAGVITLIGGVLLNKTLPTKSVRIGSHAYQLLVAQTKSQHAKGLSGKRSMGVDQGMLFVFAHSSEQCFWMRDVRFALDIIWLSTEGRVVFIRENTKPDSYPEMFCPKTPAQYVIELTAGQIAANGLRVGDHIAL